MTEVCFPDGTRVRGAALSEPAANDGWREYGLYLDDRWTPTWPSRRIDWPDLGLPAVEAEARAAIRETFELASSGVRVEVGCAGGTGRTGTVLACMAVLAGVPREEAVRWVRDRYDPRAVETPAQEHWVLST
jgi:hypothetical protein